MLVTVARGDRTNSNVNCGDTAGICGGLGQIHFMIGTNIFYYWDKYILRFGQMHFSISTNAVLREFGRLGQIHFMIAICNLDKYILQFGQMDVMIWTNTFCKLDKYNVNCRDTAGICGGWLKSMVASLYYSTLPVSCEN